MLGDSLWCRRISKVAIGKNRDGVIVQSVELLDEHTQSLPVNITGRVKEDGYWLPSGLCPVTVYTVDDGATPDFVKSRNRWQLVLDTGGEHNLAPGPCLTLVVVDLEERTWCVWPLDLAKLEGFSLDVLEGIAVPW